MLKIVIAEDDLMIADEIEDTLVENGYQVCGIARTVADMVALCRRFMPDLAIIDFRLADGGFGTDILPQLADLSRIGVLYATGNASQVMQIASNGDACLAKPYRSADLLRSLEVVRSIVATGQAVPPFPRGLQVLTPAPAAIRCAHAR
jgi:DNA-binding response OmpR family regulator